MKMDPAIWESTDATAAWWMRGPHLQTTWARLVRSRRMVRFEREVLKTADDDELVLDHASAAGASPRSPRVLLLHGLEGSAYSLHTQGLARLIVDAGWRATVLNFRSCARDPGQIRRRLRNRRPRLYHAGETGDLDLVVGTLSGREPAIDLHAVGFSLGGSVLLKWLGEQGSASRIVSAATISVPYDLAASARFLERRAARFYVANFMYRLKAKALDVVARFPRETAHLDANRIRAARTLRQFDECVTAPLHGFPDAGDYYRRSSAIGYLSRVAVPTLCISSADDPFFPADDVVRATRVASRDITFQLTPWGGHVGFVTGRWPWRPRYWAEERAVSWLRQHGRFRPPAVTGALDPRPTATDP